MDSEVECGLKSNSDLADQPMKHVMIIWTPDIGSTYYIHIRVLNRQMRCEYYVKYQIAAFVNTILNMLMTS